MKDIKEKGPSTDTFFRYPTNNKRGTFPPTLGIGDIAWLLWVIVFGVPAAIVLILKLTWIWGMYWRWLFQVFGVK